MDRLEELGEILPGSGSIILAELPPSGSLPAALAALFDAVYGRPEVYGRGDDSAPAREPSIYLNLGEARSLAMPPVKATLWRLGLTRPEDNEQISRAWVGLTVLPSPAAARVHAIVTRHSLYDDDNQHLLRRPHGAFPLRIPRPGRVGVDERLFRAGRRSGGPGKAMA